MAITVIQENGDLTVEIIEKSEDTFSANREAVTLKTAHFIVDKAVLTKASQILLQMLTNPNWQESSKKVVSLGEGRIAVADIWLSVIHKTKLTYTLPFKDMWYLVEAIDYYQLDLKQFNAFFASWLEKSNTGTFKSAELLYPTFRFDHAKMFALSTRTLAYEVTGHIMEKNPSSLLGYHLPSRIIRMLKYQLYNNLSTLTLIQSNLTLLKVVCERFCIVAYLIHVNTYSARLANAARKLSSIIKSIYTTLAFGLWKRCS